MDKTIADNMRERLRRYDDLQDTLNACESLLLGILNKEPLQIEIKHGGDSILFRRGRDADVLIRTVDTTKFRQAMHDYVEQRIIALRHQIADLV